VLSAHPRESFLVGRNPSCAWSLRAPSNQIGTILSMSLLPINHRYPDHARLNRVYFAGKAVASTRLIRSISPRPRTLVLLTSFLMDRFPSSRTPLYDSGGANRGHSPSTKQSTGVTGTAARSTPAEASASVTAEACHPYSLQGRNSLGYRHRAGRRG
jgi:hypothetical protein